MENILEGNIKFCIKDTLIKLIEDKLVKILFIRLLLNCLANQTSPD